MITAERDNHRGARRRRRRRPHRLVQTDRRAEIWIVAAVSLVLLGTGISWIVSIAYPDTQQNVTAAPSTAPPQDASSGNAPPTAVIILQDKSAGPDNKPPEPTP